MTILPTPGVTLASVGAPALHIIYYLSEAFALELSLCKDFFPPTDRCTSS